MRNVVILGMHRSGTSLVAGTLAAAGVYVGESGELLSDQQDNPRGFWERSDVVALNDVILQATNGAWFSPPEALSAQAWEHAGEVTDILRSLPQDQSWLVKDPRMLLTWPLWQEPMADAVPIFVYRDPCAVAVSLNKRNNFPLTLGLALWQHYNLLALAVVRDADALMVSFEQIVREPHATLSALLQSLVDRGVSCPHNGGIENYDADLGGANRAHATLTLAESLLSPSQRALDEYCSALCEARQSPPPEPGPEPLLLPRINDLAGALAPLAAVVETRNELFETRALCDERTDERDQSLAQLRDMEADHQKLAAAHELEVANHAQLVQDHHARQAIYEELNEAHNTLSEEHRLLTEKADYLFTALSHAYGKLLEFEQSALAVLWRGVGLTYKTLTLRSGINTGYDDTLDDAKSHFEQHGLALPRKPQNKLGLITGVAKYVAQNPAGSVRSFSLPRLKRGLSVLLRSTPEDFGVWVDSRFPPRDPNLSPGDLAHLDASLDSRRITLPACIHPRVSIVVPVYNNYRVTVNCLLAVLDNTVDIPYEVILGDDCSDDLTQTIEERVANVRVVRGEVNQGFVGNCNAAAAAARGDYIVFLNNDTAVCPRWLPPLLRLLEQDPTVGIVGPKLLFGDGKLQEAGGIIWRDASGWNFGRGDAPDKPAYNYLKPVDYVSGACLMIRTELWQRLGGFDSRYQPAYYEDADLCFATRAAGYQVLYQPLSRVYHFEGLSNGTDLNSGIKQHQVINQAKFAEKWQRELAGYHFDNAEHVIWARDRSRQRRTVLFIDHYVPHHDKDAGSRSTLMYVELMLAMGYRVMFMGANFFPHKPYTEALQQLGVEVLVGEYMARNLDHWLREHTAYIDTIYLHRPHVAEQFLDSLDKMQPRPPVIFFGHDLHYLRITRQQQLTQDAALARSATSWRKREQAVFDRVDKIYYPSEVEVQAVRESRPELDVRAIPLYVLEDVQARSYEHADRDGILFVGGFNHPPNVDAVCWFVQEVLPRIHAGYPDTQFHVVGSNPNQIVEQLSSEKVTVYGYLPDAELSALYRRVQLAVVPLRYGAGVKGKVLEAIQSHVPLVTTASGAEGVPEAERVMAIADSAEVFAVEVLRVIAGDEARLAMLEHYAGWLARHYSRARAEEIVLADFGAPLRQIGVAEVA